MASIKKSHPFNDKPEDSMKQSLYSDQQQHNHNQLNLDNNQIHEFVQIKTTTTLVSKRAHHATCLSKDNKMYVYGGYEAGGAGILEDFLIFDVINKKWEIIYKKNLPGARHSHSMIIWNNKIILFGGVISTLQATNTIFSYDLSSPSQGWKQLKFTNLTNPSIQLPYLNSHKAILSSPNTMLIFFGQTQQKYSTQIYLLNLLKNEFQSLPCPTLNNFTPRLDCSINLYRQKVYIFGGKIQGKRLNELWCYDIKENQYKKIQYEENSMVVPFQRSDHSAVVYEDFLVVFAGSSGVTHERNDLLYYDLLEEKWYKHWPDHSQNVKFATTSNRQSCQKKSRSNSVKKLVNSLVSKNGQSYNNDRFKNESQQNQKFTQQTERKYRRTMKNQNYYNENYPFYGQRQYLLKNKHKKNDLLVDIQKQARQQKKKIPLNLSQTFESLNHSIIINNSTSKNQSPISSSQNWYNKKDQKQKDTNLMKYPKPRDGHTCQLYNDIMIIFGGDRHHMSYNDILLIDLSKVLPQRICLLRNKDSNQGIQENQNDEKTNDFGQNDQQKMINNNGVITRQTQKEKNQQVKY